MGILKQIAESVFKHSKKYEAKDTKVKKSTPENVSVKEEEARLEREFLKAKEESLKKNALENIVTQEQSRWKTVEEEEHQMKIKMAEHLGVAQYKSHSVTNPGHGEEHQSQAYQSNSHQHEHEKHYHSHDQQSNYQH